MNCRKCGIELTDENWYKTQQIKQDYICKKCAIHKGIEYYRRNTENRLKYYKDNVEARRRYQENYIEMNKTKIVRDQSIRRGIGFLQINLFEHGLEAHHISDRYIIYIPRCVHRSVWHRLNKPATMRKINKIAIHYLHPGILPKFDGRRKKNISESLFNFF